MIEKDIDLDALVQRLGKVGAINYVMSINKGSGDCVKDKHERDAMFERMGVTVNDIADAIRQQSKNS
ncbi:MAG: hypothetical protein FWG31_03710 [Oscillospiraceae bacterium]|nr:hypothetical protein [Oscillospiraceae bacterium]